MFKNSFKMLFLFTLMMGSMMSISSNSWFGVWMGLEINLLSFIPLMINTNNLMSTEAALKYFLVQALASSFLLFIVIYMMIFFYNNLNNKFFMNLVILSSMFLKMGAAPFHFWFITVMEGLNWINNMILMTWQKIAPLMILSYCLELKFLLIIIILSIFFGALGGLNQTSLRKILAFSSVNHLGWMLMGMIYNENIWMTYYLFYCFLSILIILLFNNFKIFYLKQMFNLFNSNLIVKLTLFLSLLSLGGLPPFLGFFPKWLIIETLINTKMIFMLMLMVILTLITLFFYLRICYSAFLLNHNEMKWSNNNFYKNKNYYYCYMTLFFSLFGMMMLSSLYLIN